MSQCIMLVLATLVPASASASEQWALIVTGSKTYENYRHHADVAHAYQRLVAGGLPEDHIVSLQFGDVPWDPQNPYPGKLYNRPTGSSPGRDVNRGFHPTFGNESVTAERVLAALRCNTTAPCVASASSDASLFIFWAGHGGDGLLFMPDMRASSALYADELLGALRAAQAGSARSAGFARIAMYVEACDSGSVFDGLLTAADAGIYALTASKAGENSYPTCVLT
jgi:legumain